MNDFDDGDFDTSPSQLTFADIIPGFFWGLAFNRHSTHDEDQHSLFVYPLPRPSHAIGFGS